MSTLGKEIRYIKGVGAVKARDFSRMGVNTLYDSLFDFPFRYDDLSEKAPIAELKPGQKVTIRGRIGSIANRKSAKSRRMIVTEAIVEDGTGSIKVIWFHQGFLTKTLRTGTLVSLSGKIDDRYGLSLVNPAYEVVGDSKVTQHTGRIVPIYSLAGALTQKLRRQVVESAMKSIDEIKDWLPKEILKRHKLVDLDRALSDIHFPDSTKDQEEALERLKFDEFFLHQLLHAKARRELKRQVAPAIKYSDAKLKKAVKDLPFELTDAQRKSVWAIIQDMEKDEPMNRLLEGDVGTGKTVVAALVALNAAADGWQSALLAPTEILAEQHVNTLEKLFGDRLTIAVFTRTKRRVKGKEVTKSQMLDALHNGKIDLVIGTHAILSADVLFNRLGLIVVDEQHRFGVKQRQALKDRKGDADGIPHLLSMTATPIPRSLALVLYGDLDRSLLDEYPAGRKAIETRIVLPNKEEEFYEKMRDEMDEGRQVFVVCPLIEESDALGVQSVNEVYSLYNAKPFAAYNIGMLHGKLKSKEKDEIMAKFVSGDLDMVISTTVVEVGVDVPNATVMFIEGAERFGLAQLHQLRGRVGRGEYESFCFLHPSGELSDLAKKRLQAVVQTQNGFMLADQDLRLRGPGNIFGTSQSGFEAFKLGSYADVDLIAAARDEAKDILDEDPDLNMWPLLKQRVLEYVDEIHFE
ncbi:ATP-dependent DNA helicase RecG [Candidatus Uhrbacteria bacterium]|jgi:ATP-dependent DNA helicase RecG|nr:ATP-dependent DNA helicase RecG [Candidatus Uhrbacteria bacterium]